MNTSHLNWIDSAKGLLISLVVLGHISTINGDLKDWIFTFHMPAFFIISGFLFSYNNEKNKSIKIFIIKKIKSIVVPYLWFSLFSILYTFVSNLILGNGIKPVLVCVFETFSTLGIYALWFLPTLFFTYLLSYIAFRFLSAKLIVLTVSCSFLISYILSWQYNLSNLGLIVNTIILVIGRILFAFPMFVIGYFLVYLYKRVKYSKKVLLIIGAFLFMVSVLLYILSKNVVDLCVIKMGNPIIYLFGAIAGTIGVLCLCHVHSFKILEFFGRNSLIIMATHVNFPFFDISKLFLSLLITIDNGVVYTILVFVSTMLIEVIVIFVVNKLLPFAVGRKYGAFK